MPAVCCRVFETPSRVKRSAKGCTQGGEMLRYHLGSCLAGGLLGEGRNFIACDHIGQCGLPLCRAAKWVLEVHWACEMTAEGVETDAKSSLVFCPVFLLHGKCLRAGLMLGCVCVK